MVADKYTRRVFASLEKYGNVVIGKKGGFNSSSYEIQSLRYVGYDRQARPIGIENLDFSMGNSKPILSAIFCLYPISDPSRDQLSHRDGYRVADLDVPARPRDRLGECEL
jgi:hypothetical protein